MCQSGGVKGRPAGSCGSPLYSTGPGGIPVGLVGLTLANWQSRAPSHAPACQHSGCGTVATQGLPQRSLDLSPSLPTPKSTLGSHGSLPRCPWRGLPATEALPSLPALGDAGCWWLLSGWEQVPVSGTAPSGARAAGLTALGCPAVGMCQRSVPSCDLLL